MAVHVDSANPGALQCPRCGLFNPPTAGRCDCGWNFDDAGNHMPVAPRSAAPAPLHVWIACAGITVVLVATLFSPLARRGFPITVVWGLLPYGLLLLVGRALPAWVAAGAGCAALAAEIFVRYGLLFVLPFGGEPAMAFSAALYTAPLLIMFVAMPAGALAGWVGRWFSRRATRT